MLFAAVIIVPNIDHAPIASTAVIRASTAITLPTDIRIIPVFFFIRFVTLFLYVKYSLALRRHYITLPVILQPPRIIYLGA